MAAGCQDDCGSGRLEGLSLGGAGAGKKAQRGVQADYMLGDAAAQQAYNSEKEKS